MTANRTLRKILGIVPIVWVTAIYVVWVRIHYWTIPTTKDSVMFSYISAFPQKFSNVYERYFLFYVNRILTIPFGDRLEAFATISVLYHAAIVVMAFLIVRKISGHIQGVLAAVLTSLFPLFFLSATENFVDTPALLFGLCSMYFAIDGVWMTRRSIACFVSGFFLAASISSKIFGIVFILPVIYLVWPSRSLARAAVFIAGGLVVIALTAIGDGLWLKDPLYHLNPANYLAYNNRIGGSLEITMDPDKGRHLFRGVFDQWFIAYLLYLFSCIFVVSFRFFTRTGERRRDKKTLALAAPGVLLLLLFSHTSFRYPGWGFASHYLYLMIVPWIVAFCAALDAPEGLKDENRWLSMQNCLAFGIIAVYTVLLIVTKDLQYAKQWDRLPPSVERFVFIFSFWTILVSIPLVMATGSALRRERSKFLIPVLFLTSSALIIGHQIVWAGKFSARYSKDRINQERREFADAYKIMAKNAPVLFGYDIPGRKEVVRTAQIATKNIGNQIVFDNFANDLKGRTLPVYVFMKSKVDKLDVVAGHSGNSVFIVPGNRYFGCSFFLISDGNFPSLRNLGYEIDKLPNAIFHSSVSVEFGQKAGKIEEVGNLFYGWSDLGRVGEFLFSVSNDHGDLSLRMFSAEEAAVVLRTGITHKTLGLDLHKFSGCTFIAVITARLRYEDTRTANVFIQDRVREKGWEREAVEIRGTSWRYYVVAKTLRDDADHFWVGAFWRPLDAEDWLEIKEIRLYADSKS